MCSKVFYIFVLIAFVVNNILTEESEPSVDAHKTDKCALITNCYDCASNYQCQWSNYHCTATTKRSLLPWFTKMSHCMYKGNKYISDSKKYCNEVPENQLPFAALISKEILKDKVPQLFCKWTLSSLLTNLEYKLEYKKGSQGSSNQFALVVSSVIGIEDHSLNTDFVVSRKGIKSITIYYYGSNITQDTYNDFTLKIEDGSKFSYLIIVVLLSTLALSVLTGLLFSICRVRYIKRIQDKIDQINKEEKIRKIEEMLHQVPFQLLKVANMSTCMICLENFEEDSIVNQFECKHIYHYDCIKKWIEEDYEHSKCPNCKRALFNNETKSHSESLTVINFPTSIQTRLQLNQIRYNQNSLSREYNSSHFNNYCNTAICLNVNSQRINNNGYNLDSHRKLIIQSQPVAINVRF